MKISASWIRAALALGLISAAALFFLRPPAFSAAARRKAVVVELFTSEGCSSCPPADQLLSRLESETSSNGAQIIPLGFHVDYWDDQGWRDRFSSHSYTQRQEQYSIRFHLDGPYTPQMVVDGGVEFVGNDSRRAEDAVARAAAEAAQVEVRLTPKPGGKLQVQIESISGASAGDVMLALTEDNLSSKVGAGENDGHILRHSAVVRDFRRLGELQQGRFQTDLPLQINKEWKSADLRLVVFVQSGSNGPIAGAASLPWSSLAAGR